MTCPIADEALTVAVHAARAGAAVLVATDRARLHVTYKDGPADISTSADHAAQAAVVHVLRATFPEHTVVGEEGSETGADTDHSWYVDGLDGTSNFTHGLPWYAVSVALRCRGEVVVGAVYDPVHGELFSAARGHGSTGNGHPLRVDATADVAHALVVTQIQSADPERIATHARTVETLLNATAGVRSPGAPALILAHIAAGHYTAYVERAMAPWDVSAGQLILEEAGGRVTDLSGRRLDSPDVADVVATNGTIHDELLEVLRGVPR